MRKTKTLWVHSLIALLLCASMLIGTTFAWFTDTVTSSNNVITAGNLDLEMYWTYDLASGTWYNVEDEEYNTIFGYDNWEPGYTEVRYIKLVNKGNLALNYQLSLTPQGTVGKLAEVIDVYYSTDGVAVSGRDAVTTLTHSGLLNNLAEGGVAAKGALLPEGATSTEAPSGEVIVTLAMSMQTTAGNEYQEETIGDGFTVTALATQQTYENDSFGDDYDEDATYPDDSDDSVEIKPDGGSATVTPDENGELADSVTVSGTTVTATLPRGVKLADGTSEVKLTVTPMEETTGNVTLGEGEEAVSVDVHIDGVAEDNDTAIIVELGKILPVGLNMDNVKLYHVEDGVTNEMPRVSLSDLDEHNEYYYDAATGEVTVAMASFSEVMAVNEPAQWNGDRDYSWYNADATELTIANADQLAGLSAIVGGMDGQTIDSFKGKTIKMACDIVINDMTDEDGRKVVFYPIGYYNTTESYEKEAGGSVSSGFQRFEGTFDGNGHTISKFYQNTWEMFGDYNDGYSGTPNHYRDGMGLFGKVYGGTVKNLTIDQFSSDGEFTTTGCVAAYADCGATFKNIAITNCNPRVYNIGNGGIVGCVGWYANDDGAGKVKFNNITVDNTNKISALWGSWDVACGGIVGQYYPTSGQSNAIQNPGIEITDCHVAAQIDVYNDVCANYQYYAYRYAGMLIGSIRENVTGEDGHVYPKMDGITAEKCTVHFGDWNDYYYCELVANSLASYTHDHQMSRLEQVAEVNVETMKVTPLKGETKDIPTSGRVNYVVVKEKNDNGMWIHGDGENYATCYHFVDGAVWNHADAGKETVDNVEVLKEDKQLVYREFNQLFTGYGWGVTSKGLTDFNGVTNMDIQHSEDESSVEKFRYIGEDTYQTGTTLSFGELFKALPEKNVEVNYDPDNVQIFVAPVDSSNTTIKATYTKSEQTLWGLNTLKLEGTGEALLTITDYYYCKPTEARITITSDSTVPANAPEIKIDFTQFARDAYSAAQSNPDHWWHDMEPAKNVDIYGNPQETTVNGVWTGRYSNKPEEGSEEPDTGAMTEAQAAAYDAMLADMQEDYYNETTDWYLDESGTSLKTSDKKKGFWLWGDKEGDAASKFGISFYSDSLDTAGADFAFVVRAKEAGLYKLNMDAFFEGTVGAFWMDHFLDPRLVNNDEHGSAKGNAGSGYVDILVNGEVIVNDFELYGTFENGLANVNSLNTYLGSNIWLDKGENVIEIRPARDLGGDRTSHRRHICLESLTLTKIADCTEVHPETGELYYCDVCGKLCGAMNENITFIDFKYAAQQAATQDFWDYLQDSTSGDKTTKYAGYNGGTTTGMKDVELNPGDAYTQQGAYDALLDYLWRNYGWTIDEAQTCLKTDGASNEFVALNAQDAPWGLAYLSDSLNDSKSELYLTIGVEKSGWYDIDLNSVINGNISNWSDMTYQRDASGAANIYINDELVVENHPFYNTEKLELKGIYLEPGRNTIKIVTTQYRNGGTVVDGQRRMIHLKSLVLEYKGLVTYTIDFKQFAKDAADQSWWNELAASGSSKIIGEYHDGSWKQNMNQAAYNNMLTYMEQNYIWSIDEDTTGMIAAMDTTNANFLLFNDGDAPWGIAYHSSGLDGAEQDVLQLNVEVEKSGWYKINTDAYYEAIDGGTLNTYTNLPDRYVGSGYADVLVNGEMVDDVHSFSGGANALGVSNKAAEETVGYAYLDADKNNTITINTVRDVSNLSNGVRHMIYLNSIDLVWVGGPESGCPHAYEEDTGNTCIYCGKIVIDFKQFAQDAQANAATEDVQWWNDLKTSQGAKGSSKFFGVRSRVGGTETEIGAYDYMRQAMEEYGWTIDEDRSRLETAKLNKGIWLNAADETTVPWGLAYLAGGFTPTDVDGSELVLKVYVDEAGSYDIAMSAFHEEMYTGIFHKYTGESFEQGLTGSGYAKIIVNDTVMPGANPYAFSAAPDSENAEYENQLKNVELGTVDLKAGENTIIIDTTANSYGITNSGHLRRVICLNSITLERVGESTSGDDTGDENGTVVDPQVIP